MPARMRPNIRSAAPGSTRACGRPSAIVDVEARAALRRDPRVGFVQPPQQSGGIDRAFAEIEAAAFEPRRRVEIVDRAEQPARLLHDRSGAAAIGRRRRAHILALDHLGEADDRVQWRAQLVDQLAQRIGGELGAEHARPAPRRRRGRSRPARGRRAVPR